MSSKWTAHTSAHIPYQPKPSGRLILRQGVEIISYVFVSFTVICLLLPACMSRENHCPIFPIHLFFCKQMQTVKKVCSGIDPRGTTWLPTLPKLGFAGCVLSCYQPNIEICPLSHCFYTRQQYEETETFKPGCPHCRWGVSTR